MADSSQDEKIQPFFGWTMTDMEWRAAGCPPLGSLDYALAAARLKPDNGRTYRRLLARIDAVYRGTALARKR